jgi:hypothetical protein
MTRAIDNPLVLMWARKRMADLQRKEDERELRQIVADLHEAQRQAAPYIKRARAERLARMRQDGPTGFVMVIK